MAQVDYFLKIADVEGESKDDRHRGEIDLESFGWGESNPRQTGGTAGRVQPEDFRFVKTVDKSSPVLMVACATGQVFRTAILSGRKAADGQTDYLKVTMEDVRITSYQVGGFELSSNLPTDQASLTFATLELSYRPQNPDGTLGPEVKRKFDFVRNAQV